MTPHYAKAKRGRMKAKATDLYCADCGEAIKECTCPCTYFHCEDGYVWGSDLGDPFWYDDDELYPCLSCNGTGLARKMTLW